MKIWDRVLTDTYQPHAWRCNASCNYNCKLIKSIPTNKDNKVSMVGVWRNERGFQLNSCQTLIESQCKGKTMN
jgi:hypothetical protein